MASEWTRTTLGEITEMLSGGTPSKSNPDYWRGSIPWASAKDMKSYFLADTEDHISDQAVKQATKLVPAGTVLLLTRGMTLLNDIPICLSTRAMTFNQDVKAVRAKNGLLQEYLPYLLLGHKPDLLDLVDLAGHGTGRLNSDELKGLPVLLPPQHEQIASVQLLKALDERIKNLADQNSCAETLARTIFKSWFVDVDPVRAKAEGFEPEGMDPATAALFPSSFEELRGYDVPRGWKVVSIGEIATLDKGLSYKGDFLTASGMPMINLGCFKGGGGFDLQKLKFYSGEYKAKHVVRSGDLVIANTDITQKRNVIGSPAIVPISESDEYLFTHHTFVVRPSIGLDGLTRYLYFMLLQSSFRERAIGFAMGTTVLALPRDAVLEHELVLPDALVLNKFTSIIDAMMRRINANSRHSSLLTDLRDTILPRLVSGKVRIAEAAKLVEAAL
ncbi:MAG TPA: restriction endonuclease subunit S [Terracidiphilus sp.]|jgi:type I restriction enzyme S subunit